MAREESDEASAIGETGTGGKLPYFDSRTSQLVQEFADAILKPGLKPGELLAPFKSRLRLARRSRSCTARRTSTR